MSSSSDGSSGFSDFEPPEVDLDNVLINALRDEMDEMKRLHGAEVRDLKKRVRDLEKKQDDRLKSVLKGVAAFQRETFAKLSELTSLRESVDRVGEAIDELNGNVLPVQGGEPPRRRLLEVATNSEEMVQLRREVAAIRDESTKGEDVRSKVKALSGDLSSIRKEVSEISSAMDLASVKLPSLSRSSTMSRRRHHHRERGGSKKRSFLEKEYDLKKVVKVQSCVRRWLARREFRRRQVDGMKQNEFEAALRLQSVVRAWLGKRRDERLELYRDNNAAVIRAQAVIRARLERLRYKKLLRRTEIAKEILSSEKTYVNMLDVLLELFHRPLVQVSSSAHAIISPEDVRHIFSYPEVIRNTNALLLEGLEEKIARKWSEGQCLGDAFLRMADFLKAYTQYVNNYPRAIRTLERCEKNSKFKAWLDEAERNPRCQGLDVQSFLILPIQRIPRYVLLLQDLLKNTSSVHEDYSNISSSLEKIRDVANEIDEKIQEQADQAKVIKIADQIHTKLDKPLLQAGRCFMREGDVSVSNSDRHIFLFSDALMVCKPPSRKGYTVVDFVDFDLWSKVNDVSTSDSSLVLVHGAKVRMVLKFEDANAKDSWKDLFNQLLQVIVEKRLSFAAGAERKGYHGVLRASASDAPSRTLTVGRSAGPRKRAATMSSSGPPLGEK